jgi:hypothetical protein
MILFMYNSLRKLGLILMTLFIKRFRSFSFGSFNIFSVNPLQKIFDSLIQMKDVNNEISNPGMSKTLSSCLR